MPSTVLGIFISTLLMDALVPITLLEAQDGRVRLWPDAFNEVEANECFARLMEHIEWKSESIRMFGKWIEVPRLVAWHGDADATYTYSGVLHTPEPWTEELLLIKNRIQAILEPAVFNSVLVNRYRSGRDYMGWHQDNERALGQNPVIASVSFGASRRFDFRSKKQRLIQSTALRPGSLLVMDGPFQDHWQHRLPKAPRLEEERINLTFRQIVG